MTTARRAGLCGAAKRDTNSIHCLIIDWSKKTGRPRSEWWTAAQADGLKPGCGNKRVFRWLRNQLNASAKATGDN